MADKQDRYRKRKAEQGFQRVEVLVPEDMAMHLKGYARALRDAHTLGLDPPLFEGMRNRSRNILPSVEQNIQPTEEQLGEANQDQPVTLPSKPAQTHKTTRPTKPKPDFSGGLLDK